MFICKKWDNFCKMIVQNNIKVETAHNHLSTKTANLILKHDVETKVKRAYRIAQIEQKNGLVGSYYVQGYLLEKKKNIKILKKMQEMGHEIAYHYDVMDFSRGDMEKARVEFERNLDIFVSNGFISKTTCQHGNPLIIRKGYNSNRDFMRNHENQEKYGLYDIMVNYHKVTSKFQYISDAGRQFKIISNPLDNDLVDEHMDIILPTFNDIFAEVKNSKFIIISIHPHRWFKNAFTEKLNRGLFKVIRFIGKTAYKIPFLRKIISKYYYLAKKA